MTEVLTPLIRAGDNDAVIKALGTKRYNLDAVDENGYTALYLCCMRESTAALVPHLLAAGAQPDVKGSDKETPLYIACFNGLTEAAKRLIKGGANVNEINGPEKETALHVAAHLGHDDLVALLLDSGVNINFRNANMETPLFAAAKANRLDVVYRLLLAGANKTLQNTDAKDPLYIASERGHKGCVELLKADSKHLGHAWSNAQYEERHKPKPLPPTSAYEQQTVAPAKDAVAAVNTETAAAAGTGATKKPEPPAKAEGAKRNASPAKKLAERVASGAPAKPEPAHESYVTPAVPIDVPEPVARTHDPLTGKKLPPCKTWVEAGDFTQEPPPKSAVKDFPEMHANYGGTTMVIGAGEDSVAVKRPLFEPTEGDVFANVILPGDRRGSNTG